MRFCSDKGKASALKRSRAKVQSERTSSSERDTMAPPSPSPTSLKALRKSSVERRITFSPSRGRKEEMAPIGIVATLKETKMLSAKARGGAYQPL